MKNLYGLQTLLVVIFSLLVSPWAFSQLSDPIHVNVKNAGTSYVDQFAASTDYVFGIEYQSNLQLGNAGISVGTVDNTLKVTFTPAVGAIGTTDLIVSFYTLSVPMHPVTKWYRFHVVNELVIAGQDRYLVDSGAVDVVLNVLENDSSSGGALYLSTVSVLNTGSAIINDEGDAILFSPDADFTGDTWIQYIACDSSGNCAQANAHILVRDPDLQDNLSFKKYVLNQEPLEILTPFEGFSVDIAPTNGTLNSVTDYAWVYTPNTGFAGKDTFQVGLAGLVTRTYYITVYQKAVNVQARDDKYYVRPGLSVSFNVLNNDILDFDLASFTLPTRGVLSQINNGLFTYSPNVGFRGVDKFTYTSCYQDTVYCESATVYIHVSDLEPENLFTYSLQTTENLPLTIDHPIAYTDFAYIISEQPQHGELINYAGLQTVNLPCDTLDSYNLLVYVPDAGYTGDDHFEYYYCILPTNLCYLVKVDMNVIEAPEAEVCPCVVDCAWPGDANLDGRVDMNDLLTIGHRLGETGLPRVYADPEVWFGQHAESWPFSGTGHGVQYLDANGDGVITSEDVDVIDTYYNRTHDVIVRDVQQKLPYQFSIIPVQFSLDSGDVVILDISIGTANVPVLDMMGTKFSVNIPPAMMDSSSVQVLFHQDSWLAEGSPSVSLGKVPWDGRIDGGYSKANGNGSSGFGVIATIVFIIEEDIEGFKTNDDVVLVPISLHAGAAMGSDGTIYDVDGDEVMLTYNRRNTKKDDYKLIVYPNPAQDLINIHLNGKTAIEDINLIDPQGRVIHSYSNIQLKHHQLDVSVLPSGIYYLQVRHTHGVMTQLVSVIR